MSSEDRTTFRRINNRGRDGVCARAQVHIYGRSCPDFTVDSGGPHQRLVNQVPVLSIEAGADKRDNVAGQEGEVAARWAGNGRYRTRVGGNYRCWERLARSLYVFDESLDHGEVEEEGLHLAILVNVERIGPSPRWRVVFG